MTKIRFFASALVGLLFALALSAAAQAQTRQRTFVSAAGNDANDCSELMPCRNWQPAIDKVIVGGEVVALDSTGFGPINITKAVTITGEGVHAVSRAADAGGNAVTVNAPGATVTLRHLYVQNNTLGTGTNGINATDFSALHIESATVNGFGGPNAAAIFSSPTASATREIFIKDSILRNNANGLVVVANGPTTATVEGTRAENNNGNPMSMPADGNGFFFQSTAPSTLRATLNDCVGSGNVNGFIVVGASAEMNIEHSVASNNSFSGIATGGATVRVSNSTVTNNVAGFFNAGGTFQSRVNNTVAGNVGNSPATPIMGL